MKGLGDAVARVIEAVGIKPCDDCKQRQAALNRAFPFSPTVTWKLTLPEGFRLRKQGQKVLSALQGVFSGQPLMPDLTP
mgnify:CR=1 FL=1